MTVVSRGPTSPPRSSVSGPAPGLPPLLPGWRLRLGWLDDVRGGRLGRVRGILAGRGEWSLQLGDDGPEVLQLGVHSEERIREPEWARALESEGLSASRIRDLEGPI